MPYGGRPLQQMGPMNWMNMQPPQQQQEGSSVGDAIGGAIAQQAQGFVDRKAAKGRWDAALDMASPNPEAPVSTTQGPAPPLMTRKPMGMNPMQVQQVQGALNPAEQMMPHQMMRRPGYGGGGFQY